MAMLNDAPDPQTSRESPGRFQPVSGHAAPEGVRKWTRHLMTLRTRLVRLTREKEADAAALRGIADEALDTSVTLLNELAGAQLQIDALTRERHQTVAHWDSVLEHMPAACVITDAQGSIVSGNRAAGVLLNLSTRALRDRLLLHYVTERDGFFDMLAALQAGQSPVTAALTIRPRDRASSRVRAVVLPCLPADTDTWFWFMLPDGSGNRGEGNGQACEPPAGA